MRSTRTFLSTAYPSASRNLASSSAGRGRTAALDGLAGTGAVGVERDLGPAVRLAGDRGEGRVRLELLELVGVDAAGVVELTGLERLDHGVRVLEELDHHLVRVALRAPVLGVAGEAGVLAGLPLLEDVRPRAHERRVERVLRDLVVVLVLVDVRGEDGDVDLEDAVRLVRGVGDEGGVVRALNLGHAGVLDPRVQVARADVRLRRRWRRRPGPTSSTRPWTWPGSRRTTSSPRGS